MSFPHYSQLEYSDCGATCLKIILKYYKKKCSLEYLRDICDTTRSGVTMSDLLSASKKLNFESVSLLCTTDWLVNNAVLPCIVHWKQEHFVVLYKITKNHFYVSDPAFGKIRLKKAAFENWWKESNDRGIVLYMEPSDGFESMKLPSISTRESLRRTLSYYREATKNQQKLFLVLLFVIAVATFLAYLFPNTMQSIIDKGIQQKDVSILWAILGFQFTLIMGQTIFNWVQGWIRVKISMNVSIKMVTQLLLKVIRLPVRFFDTKVPTDIYQRIDDQKHIEHFISDQLIQTFFSIIITIVLTIRLFIYNTTIGLVFTLLSIFSIVWIFLFYRWRRQLDYTSFRLNSENHNLINEMINGMVEIKINNAQNAKISHWQKTQKKIYELKYKILHLGVYQNIGVQLITQVKNIFITFLCAYWVIQGDLTLGTMLSIGFITGLLSNPIDSLASFSQLSQEAQLAFTRLDEIRQREDEVKPEQVPPPELADDSISFKNVSFKYEGGSQTNVINNLNVDFKIGKVTAIVGNSGSGKSTLLKLLLNFYTPQSGSIYLDNLDFKAINPEEWRKQCGIVLQDGYIFSGTIGENIAVGEDTPDTERLWDAARIACIDDFVNVLPMKFNTRIGNTGTGISGGQKQRILIARAVYKNPNFLFFDEATSSLDANNERKIMNNLTEFFEGKTVVIIAHRLSTVKNADQIIVLDNGQISEIGDHEQLARTKGKYFELVKNQLELGN